MIVILGVVAVAALQSTTGKGFSPKTPVPSTPPARAPSTASFETWAEENGIQRLAPLAIRSFGGERGVGATAAVEAGANILQVPTKLSLQVSFQA